MTNYYFGCRFIHLSAELVATIFADNIEIKNERGLRETFLSYKLAIIDENITIHDMRLICI